MTGIKSVVMVVLATVQPKMGGCAVVFAVMRLLMLLLRMMQLLLQNVLRSLPNSLMLFNCSYLPSRKVMLMMNKLR